MKVKGEFEKIRKEETVVFLNYCYVFVWNTAGQRQGISFGRSSFWVDIPIHDILCERHSSLTEFHLGETLSGSIY